MKKVYLLLCALVACVGATWAAPITALSDAVVGKVFTIRSQNRGAFVYDAKNEGYVSGSARSGYGTLDNTDKNFLLLSSRRVTISSSTALAPASMPLMPETAWLCRTLLLLPVCLS